MALDGAFHKTCERGSLNDVPQHKITNLNYVKVFKHYSVNIWAYLATIIFLKRFKFIYNSWKSINTYCHLVTFNNLPIQKLIKTQIFKPFFLNKINEKRGSLL